MVIITLVMTILRFLLNEKGRVSPDSIRFMRTSKVFPIIDNTTTPLGYPLSLKFFTLFGLDEFWSSKLVGILALFAVLTIAKWKNFYFKENILIAALFSFISIFAATLSEALVLPFLLLFYFTAKRTISGSLKGFSAIFQLSLLLIILVNIRYPALFFIAATGLYGLLNFRKNYAKNFIISGMIGFASVVLYKLLFIDYFNEKYVDTFLNVGLHSTANLLTELFQGLCTTFNPFIHIASPGGGLINFAIYGTGLLNIGLMIFLFAKNQLTETDKFMIFTGITGIVCSFFIQYFYSVDPLDYRLLAPFSFPLWLVYFRKLLQTFGKFTYSVSAASLITGFIFTVLSKGNFLENRSQISNFLEQENLKEVPLKFYLENEKSLNQMQIAELISTVNPHVSITFKPKDTMEKRTLTQYKVLKKIKIDTNKFQ